MCVLPPKSLENAIRNFEVEPLYKNEKNAAPTFVISSSTVNLADQMIKAVQNKELESLPEATKH